MTDANCTIPFVSDPFFHLLEFYIHNDAPLTCRIPARPISLSTYTASSSQIGALGSESTAYVPFTVALSGVLQLSHLHVANNLNVLLHASPKHVAPGVIDAATAYSVSHSTRNLKVKIGDPLPLRFSVRWYPSSSLPSGWTGVGGHLTLSTLVYCALSAGASAAICIVYFRGVELPRRLRRYGRDRIGGMGTQGLLGSGPSEIRGRGWGYGMGTTGAASANGNVGGGWGYSAGTGKVD